MNPKHSAAVTRVFAEVLADFAFVFGDPVSPEVLGVLEGKGLLARLPFRGDVEGSVALAVSQRLAVEIAANTLGVESADPEATRRAEDAVKEVASVLGGHLVGTIAGPTANVAFAPPELSVLQPADWERLRRDPATQCFLLNERPAMLRVDLAGEGASQ